ncbi:unnamed protein product [Amoebophrya sp. A25]|nr:unnamed protein product [Amoebophrya sp. A25]|eukprot:GSA25T00018195001.1
MAFLEFEDKAGKWSISQNLATTLEELAAWKEGDAAIAHVFLKKVAGTTENSCAGPGRRTALHLAVRRGNVDAVKFLLDKATVDVNAQDGWGDSALLMLCELAGGGGGGSSSSSTSTKRGEDHGNTKDDGEAPSNFTEGVLLTLLKCLLQREDLDLNLQNEMGSTALHLLAQQNASRKVLELLFQKKTLDVNAENLRGESALMVAVASGSTTFVELMVDAFGGDLDLSLQVDLGKEKSLMDEGDGDSLLLYAVRNGRQEILDAVFGLKLKTTEKDESSRKATILDSIRSEELLNVANKKGTVPLIHACALAGESLRMLDAVLKCAEQLFVRELKLICAADSNGKDACSSARNLEEACCRIIQSSTSEEDRENLDQPPSIIELETTSDKIFENYDADVEVFDLNHQDKRGNTCLHIAAAFGYASAVEKVMRWSRKMGSVRLIPPSRETSASPPEQLLSATSPTTSGKQGEFSPPSRSGSTATAGATANSSDQNKAKPSKPLVTPLDLNLKNREGLSVLLLAAGAGRLQVLETLCLEAEETAFSRGVAADVELDMKGKDPKGKNARQRAKASGCDEVEVFLKSYKPKPRTSGLKGDSSCTTGDTSAKATGPKAKAKGANKKKR